MDALCKVAESEFQVALCKTVNRCEGEDLAAIKEVVVAQGLTRVVLAGISPRLFEDELSPLGVIVEKVPLRDHVVWCQPPNDEDTQMMAEDYLRMALAKIQKMEPPEPFQTDLRKPDNGWSGFKSGQLISCDKQPGKQLGRSEGDLWGRP